MPFHPAENCGDISPTLPLFGVGVDRRPLPSVGTPLHDARCELAASTNMAGAVVAGGAAAARDDNCSARGPFWQRLRLAGPFWRDPMIAADVAARGARSSRCSEWGVALGGTPQGSLRANGRRMCLCASKSQLVQVGRENNADSSVRVEW